MDPNIKDIFLNITMDAQNKRGEGNSVIFIYPVATKHFNVLVSRQPR